MVDTAIFSSFHRQGPSRRKVAVEQPAPAPPHHEHSVETSETLNGLVVSEPVFADIEHEEPSPTAFEPALSALSWHDLPVSHEFIDLANPAVWTVQASFSPSKPFAINADLTGLYRPSNFRAAPWSGFAYDMAPDRRTGLVAGTQILTARGEIAVEDLLPGDTAMALRGPALLPIIWIGRCTAIEPPVMIEAGALGERRPSRALIVAADHPIFVEPVPVPAKRLVNGTTIHTMGIESAELFHVDVGQQEVLFAQNVPLASTQRPAGTTS